MKATVDFETRSAADLRTTGPYLYACHPSTEILCMAWQYGDGPDVLLWHPAMPGATSGFVGKGKDRRADVVGMPEEGRDELEALFLMIESGEIETIEAHNAMFERVIFMLVGPRYGFPKIDPRVWRCSAATSASFALPRGLDPAARALGLKQQKDTEGHALMLKLSQPAAPTKTQPDRKWRQDVDDLRRLYDYCKQDVRTEHALSTSLRSLPAVELATWQLDQEMNLRGVQVDTAFVQRALDIAETEIAACNLELDIITGGDVSSVSQVKKLLEWLNTQGWVGDSLAGGVIDEALKCELPDHVRRALELRRSASRTSTKKYAAIIASICDDGRLRDLLSYYGANTGRWCLTGDHEILTPTGWVRFDEWGGGPIACWNEAEIISFQSARPVEFPYSGEMIHHETKRIDQIATPDHRMPGWAIRTGEFEVRTADMRGRFAVPYTGTRNTSRDFDEVALRILVMVQADGHFTESGDLRLHFKKARKIERCLRLLHRAGLVFSKQEHGGTTTLFVKRRHQPLYLSMFRDKTFGWWLLNCDATVIFDELEHWDSYRAGPNSIQYSTTNYQNAEIIQACAHLSGKAAYLTRKQRVKEEWADCFYVSIWLTPSNRHELREVGKRVAFDGIVYCAETPTGFFLVRRNGKVWVTGNSGRRVQPQNFPRGTIKAKMDTMVADIMTHDVEVLRMLYSDPMELLASALRGVFVAPPGKHLFVADYAAIEARVTAWIAGQQDLLDLFASGKDVYKVQAGAVFGVPEAQIRPEQRQLGKAAVLGLGFQMGPSKFVTTCAASPYFITIPESCEHIKLEVDCECVTGFKTVRAYRQKNHKIVQLWKDLQDGAIEAITRGPGGNPVVTGKITWAQRGRFLHAKLPSGRLLSYCDPSVEMAHVVGERADGTEYDFLAPSIRFMGLSSLTHKWERQYTYGGSLTENVVQATARDLMRDAMLRLEATEVYKMILTIHDELIAEADIDRGDLREYEKLVSAIEPWAAGMPVKAEGWRGPRYHK